MTEDRNIEDWYKQEVSGIEELPDEAVWERLQNSMDRASVWKRLSASLNRWKRLIWWWKLSYKGMAVLLLLFAGYMTVKNQFDFSENEVAVATEGEIMIERHGSVADEKSERNSETETSDSSDRLAENGTTETESFYTNMANTIAHHTGTEAIAKENVIFYDDESEIALNNPRGNNGGDELEKMPLLGSFIERDNQWLTMLMPMQIPCGTDSISVEKNLLKRGWYAGVYAGAKNQWLLAPETFSGMTKQGFNYTKADFGYSAGIAIGYVLSNRIDLEGNLLVVQNGQKYVDYIEGKSIKHELDLNYTGAALIGKWKMGNVRENRKMASSNLLFGLFGNYAYETEVRLNNEATDNNEEYKKTDLGFIAGYERNYYVGERWIVAPALRYHLGLVNIYNGTDDIPASLNSTHTSSLELGVSIKFLLPK